jgi:hypothetical protein
MISQNSTSADSSQLKQFSAYGVETYDGTYHKAYSYKQWSNDVVVHANNYLSQVKYHQGELKESQTSNWIVIILLIVFSAIAYTKSFHQKRFGMLLKGFFNWKISQQIIRYEKVYFHPVNVILSVVFLVVTALFFALAYQSFYVSDVNLALLTFLIGLGIVFMALIKVAFYNFSSWLLSISEPMQDYIFQSSLFNKLFGLINFILIVLLLYSPLSDKVVIGISLLSLLIFMLMQLVRGLLIGIQNAIPMHLIILYLCTLEILPWLIIGKWIGNLL